MKNLACFILLLLSLSVQTAKGQSTALFPGTLTTTQYSDKIIKLTYRPQNAINGENISDAVILKAAKAPVTKKIQDKFQNLMGGSIASLSRFHVKEVFENDGFTGFKFYLFPNTKVFGGGERALPLNRRGYKFNLYNNPWYGYTEGADNLNYSVPFFTTNEGYGLFFDNASKGYADIGKSDSSILEVGFMGGETNVYIIFGKDYKEILAGYNKLTGTQPLPPRWVFGNLMSRFGYTSQAQATNILDSMKAQHIPVDAIIFDLFWFGDSIKGTMGNLDWVNKKQWPDPKKMIADFRKQQVNTILITEPFVVQSSGNYQKAVRYHAVDSANKPYVIGDFYFGPGGLIDIFRKDAQDWFWTKHLPQMKNGVEAWWGDLGEPEKHPEKLYHNLKDMGFNRLFKADEVHNIYGHTWTKMLYQKYAKDYPSKRLFSLNRSGFAGTQRYGIFPWSGDISRSWSGLRAQLPVMLGMSMSGIPYVHADAGGFAGGEGDNELYVRWLQFAAFTPIFRPHGTALGDVDKAAFSFPSEAALIQEPFRSYAKAAIDLRYALLPYNYTLAYKQTVQGAPLVAPLYYYYPSDTTAVNILNEFMWGENILVAPVLTKENVERKIYLPGDKAWYSLYIPNTAMMNFDVYKKEFVAQTPINYINAFVKAGSFVPMIIKTNGENTSGYTTDSLQMNYYYDAQSSTYTMYDDDGKSKNAIASKQFELLTFTATPTTKSLNFAIHSNGGKYAGKPMKRNIQLIIHGKADVSKNVFINSKKGKINYPFIGRETGPVDFYTIDVTFTGEPVNISIR